MESPGGFKDSLVELKFISAGLTYYNSVEKQVDVRAKSLQQENVCKCREINGKYCGACRNQLGPLEEHLRGYGDLIGLVVGQFGEASQGLHDLVDYATFWEQSWKKCFVLLVSWENTKQLATKHMIFNIFEPLKNAWFDFF